MYRYSYIHLTLLPAFAIIVLALLLLAAGGERLYLGLELVHLDVELVYALVEPLLHSSLLLLRGVHAGRVRQALFAVSFCLCLPLHYFETLHLL